MSRQNKCQSRKARVAKSYYDRQGKARVRHEYDYCGSKEGLQVDLFGYAYCAEHHGIGEYGEVVEVDLDAVLRDLLGRG